ncbi:MAG TPA: hypothetical protein VN817_04520 [Solirubrobacteraceae bacterium]|nr:hypothetical protein [Solirubrobacteraceae bacterium]
MSDQQRIGRPTRARPVADAPVAALLERGEELARRWAIALIVERPLAEMPEVPLEDLAREAPGVCAQVVRAYDSEAELERIAASESSRGRAGAAPTVRLGAHDARATVEHIEALRGVIWEATLAELDDPAARQVAELSDRLAFVCATLLAAALGEATVLSPREEPLGAPVQAQGQVLFTAPQAEPGKGGVALIDEFEEAVAQSEPRQRRREDEREPVIDERRFAPGTPSASRSASGASRTAPRPLPWDTPLQPPSAGHPSVERAATTERRVADDADGAVRIRRGARLPIDERD